MADRTRLAASAAALATATGTATLGWAVRASGGPIASGYLSQAGDPSSPVAGVYRGAVLTLAVALLLLALALPPTLRLATALLLASAGTATVSAAVPCSVGCPLPPFEDATTADLVHGAASIVAVAGVVLAMLAIAAAPATDRPLRRLAAVAVTLALPLSAGCALAMLTIGRGPLIGALERLLLAVAIGWAAGTAIVLAARGGRPARGPVA